MGILTYGWYEVCEETRTKIAGVLSVLPDENLLLQLRTNEVVPTRLVVLSDGIGISLNYHNAFLGIGVHMGVVILTFNHQHACYEFARYIEHQPEQTS